MTTSNQSTMALDSQVFLSFSLFYSVMESTKAPLRCWPCVASNLKAGSLFRKVIRYCSDGECRNSVKSVLGGCLSCPQGWVIRLLT